ncbi:MAG: S8 family serine peptidase [Marinobacter vinifirmus]|uniref:S8 family serine peptidase n=1 Tax=Marinobacter vinifirmus TaxID=355591 RepID=A0A558BGB3_9GAMM|nr:MAG: S8 family serine peptidase [Marinobacter vinifirmus]
MAVLAGCGGGGSSSSVPALPPSPLSGVISIEANSRVDQDTMDQLGLEGAQAATGIQALPASFVLAGYVSGAAGTYPSASAQCQPFAYAEDAVDEYSVPLAAGETLVLESFGSCLADPELELVVEGADPLPASVNGGPARYTLTAGDSTEYRVTVRNTGNAPARYILAKSVAFGAGGMAFDWPRYRFIEGEAVVALADDDTVRAAMATPAAEKARALGAGKWLMTMPGNRVRSAQAGPVAEDTLNWIRELRATPGVLSATPNYVVSSQQTGTPVSEPLYTRQWHYDLINGPAAWQLAPGGGAGVNVAVLDSGLLRLPSGTIAAVVNDAGSGGVAYGAGLVPVRVLGEGGTGSSADLIAAINWLVAGSGGQPYADVVNMSLGGLPRIQDLEDAIARGVGKGMVFVAAAGNAATSTLSYPAASPNVLAVSAVDGGGQLAGYSNFGSWIDLAAPGGDASRDGNLDGAGDVVWSTSGERDGGVSIAGYRGLQGTSMASPHVAGVLALMKARDPGINYGTVRALLRQGQLTDGKARRNDTLGWGVLDAARAVSAAGTGFADTILSASPALVSLSNEGEQSVSVELSVFGDGNVSNLSLGDMPAWIDVTGCQSAPPCALQVTLLKDQLTPDEPARGSIVVNYQVDGASADPLSMPVIGQLVSDEQARNAGRHFVLLVNTEPNEDNLYMAESQVTLDAENGVYSFRFENDDGEEPQQLREVRPGDYYLVAGSDLDGDGIICQPGEACAEYPITGLREVITIEEGQSLSDIRLTTGFSRPTISAASPDILPRPGFQGYQLRTPETQTGPADNRIRMTQ